MDAVCRYDGSFDAVIQAGCGEHGREGLQELLEVPVVDITEAAPRLAMLLGHRYSSAHAGEYQDLARAAHQEQQQRSRP